ncbi:hypothetical protein B2G69_06530 [Methylorubrum zatmanii]|nr:hypothetical protein B2G69_06530 [Methylorubrum zatmanii]
MAQAPDPGGAGNETDPLVAIFRLCTEAAQIIDPSETPRLHEAMQELLKEIGREMGRRLSTRLH